MSRKRYTPEQIISMLRLHAPKPMTAPNLRQTQISAPNNIHGGLINSPFGSQRFAKVPRRATVRLSPFTKKNVRLLQRRQ